MKLQMYLNSDRRWTGSFIVGLFLAGGACADDHSPLASFEEENAANRAKVERVMNATTAMELAELGILDKARAGKIDALSPEQRSQYLEAAIKEADVRVATAERVAGDKAVVLRESPIPGGSAEIVLMEKSGEGWATVDHSEPFHPTVMGARGSFEVSGAVDMSIEGALVEKGLWSEGEFTMMDRLGKVLTGEPPPTVTITLPTCPEPKTYEVSEPKPSFSAAFINGPTFDAQSGTITVTAVDGDRASGEFEFAMVGTFDEEATVSVDGAFTDVPIACDGSW